MDTPSRFASFHLKDGELRNRRAIYVRAPGSSSESDLDHNVESVDIAAPEGTDPILLRNILHCFHFLDTKDRAYINSREAGEYITQVKEQNPELFDLMYNVLQVVKESYGDDTIAKDLFIRICEESLHKLEPNNTSPISRLRLDNNPLTDYFKALKVGGQEYLNEEPPCEPMLAPSGEEEKGVSTPISQDSTPICSVQEQAESVGSSDVSDISVECTFIPMINKSPDANRKSSSSATILKQEIEEIHRFKCYPSVTSGMNEYIVFHFNRHNEWPRTLRSLKDYDS